MKRSGIYAAALCVLPILSAGCASSSSSKSSVSDEALAGHICEYPRPQACTMDYKPVCANMDGGSLKTYSNGCTACADESVEGWVEGACFE